MLGYTPLKCQLKKDCSNNITEVEMIDATKSIRDFRSIRTS